MEKNRESETDWSPCIWFHSYCAIEANDAGKLTRVPIQKEVLPRGRNDFLSSAVFWNMCTRLSNKDIYSHIFSYISGQISYISPIFQVLICYILLYFRSKSPIFSPISNIFRDTSRLTPCEYYVMILKQLNIKLFEKRT